MNYSRFVSQLTDKVAREKQPPMHDDKLRGTAMQSPLLSCIKTHDWSQSLGALTPTYLNAQRFAVSSLEACFRRWSTTTTLMPPLSTPISASSAKIRCGTHRCRQSSVRDLAAALSTTVASFAALAAWQVSWVIFEFLWKICCRTINRFRNATVVFTAIWKALHRCGALRK